MLTVLAFHAGDRQLAVNLAGWMAELGGCRGHSLLLLRDSGTAPIPDFEKVFDSVTELVVSDTTQKWPESANHAFAQAAVHVQYRMPQAWLWIEPDAVPLRAGWLDTIQAAYSAGNRLFMGDRVSGAGDSPEHMSGIAVYPPEMKRYGGEATIAVEIPWDLAAAEQITPQALFTPLIQHNWRPPEFNSWPEAEKELRPGAVLYHKDKTGAMIKLLREKTANPDTMAISVDEVRDVINRQPTPELVPAKPIVDADGKFVSGLGETRRDTFVPWQNKLESQERIKALVWELKKFCTRPAYLIYVRKVLHFEKIIFSPRKYQRKKR